MKPDITAKAILILSLSFVASAGAQQAVMESEPNHTPAEAIVLSGDAILIGSMSGGDQDAWKWNVSDVDAQKRWTFELRGVPGRLTLVEIMRLEYGENGTDIVGYERLGRIGTRDGLKPAIQEDLLFEPGEYILGVAGAGGGDGAIFRPPAASLSFGDDDVPIAASAEPGSYRVIISEGKGLPVLGKPKQWDTRESAAARRLGREFGMLGFDELIWHRLDFDAAQAQQKWDVFVQIPVGRDIKAELVGEAGQSLAKASADRRGKLFFKDLSPPVGSWWVRLQKNDEDGFIQLIGTESVGAQVAGEEVEPNGKKEIANRIDLSEPIAGRVSEKNEYDYFSFSIDEATADQVLELKLDQASGTRIELCLLNSKLAKLQCRESKEGVVLPDLVLVPGDYGLSVSRGSAETEYSISLTPQGSINPDLEAEPNDSLATASSVPSKNRIKGRFSGKESDYFRFVVADEPQLWRFQVIGDGIQEVGYQDSSGHQSKRVRPDSGQRRVRLDNVYLLPGTHHLKVMGKAGGSYTVLARPVGQPDPNGEREPNDDTRYMHHLAIGQTRNGLLADKDDSDYYRFFLANDDHIRLTITPPPDGSILPNLYWYNSPMKVTTTQAVGKPIVLEGVFPPGDYHFSLVSKKTSEAEYKVSLERLDRYSCSSDCEPNDFVGIANPLPPDFVVEGIAGDWRDQDVFALPVRNESTAWTLKPTPYRVLSVATHYGAKTILDYDKEAELFRGTVPAGEQYYLFVPRTRYPEYRVELDYPGSNKLPTVVGDAPVSVSLNLATSEVAAYRQNGQRVDGELSVSNTGSSTQAFELEITTSDYRWDVRLDKAGVQVPPGATVAVPVTVDVPQDVWADWPVRISAMAKQADGHQAEAYVEVSAGRETRPVNPRWGWTLPEELRGGFNVARTVLGSELVGTYDTRSYIRLESLFNDVDVRGSGMELRGGWHKQNPHRDVVVELAGGQSVEIVGTAINLFHRQTVQRDASVLEMALSDDGINFTTVIEQDLKPVKTDQYFVLDEPRSARFARLRLKHGFSGAPGEQISISEWKVISRPGADISGGRGFNLADVGLGGHIVYSRPTVAVHWDRTLLQSEGQEHGVRLNKDQEFEFVTAFHHNRAAQITKLEWQHSDKAAPANIFPGIRVDVAMESPFGPWRTLGTWDLKGVGETTEFTLDRPEWARFVRFTGPAPDKLSWRAPADTIRIWERPTDREYRSILGEWGYASSASYYESTQDLVVDKPFEPANHYSRGLAAPIKPGQAVGGSVSLGKQEHWYRLAVPAGQNTLTLYLDGDPTVRTAVHLEDAAGEEVRSITIDRETTPRHHQFEATVEGGKSYYMRVEEPPRNVIFAWDTSPSVLQYIPTIYNALVAFTEDVVPGRDAVNLLPFGKPPLLRDWYGEPYILQTVLNDYLKDDSSSAAESALRRSTDALGDLPGTKAIIVVTDAATTRHAKVWNSFEEVRPRVFSIGIGGTGGAALEQDLLQNWTDVNAGHYKHLNYDGEMEVAFDRAATMLRRPAEYRLLAETGFVEDPGPGYLSVTSGGDGSGATTAGAVELILDASGSMWQKLDGKFRINIAKEVLTEAVQNHIPAGTPTALRVFGNREPNSCRTDLEIKLQPLDATAAATTINAINPQSLAKTPIADSLAQIAGDLRGAAGPNTVVLVTDGEETCDGDPAAVIEKLRDKGIDVTLNIVGFAIGDAELEKTFADWAELGGGRYFSASDQEGLSDAITTALQVPYTVYDSQGAKIATGMVGGEPLELEAGKYRVVVSSSPQKVFETVEVSGGSGTSLDLE